MDALERVKQTLRDSENLIINYNYKELYEKIRRQKVWNKETSYLTELLYAAGIDPLKYMDEIPVYFLYNSDIKSFNIPDNITSIGNYAFTNCSSLTSITIPDSVTSIHSHVFEECSNLTSIIIPKSLTSITKYAFQGCTSLTSITIPDKVTTIDNYGFYNCSSLASITIPKSVTSIEDYAFYNCNNLTDIYYSGTKEDRRQILIGRYNNVLRSANWHYNS